MPYTQWDVLSQAFLYVRASGDPAALAASIRESVRRHDAGIPITEYRTLDEQISRLVRPERMVARFSAAFGILATLLAAIGRGWRWL